MDQQGLARNLREGNSVQITWSLGSVQSGCWWCSRCRTRSAFASSGCTRGCFGCALAAPGHPGASGPPSGLRLGTCSPSVESAASRECAVVGAKKG